MNRCTLAFTCLMAISFLCGCGGEPKRETPDTFQVTGTVIFNGEPLGKGHIEMASPEDIEKGLPPANGQIVDGKYEFRARAGKKTVKITSNEEYGEPDATGVRESRQIIPRQYNEDTTLEIEIEAQDDQELPPFELKG